MKAGKQQPGNHSIVRVATATAQNYLIAGFPGYRKGIYIGHQKCSDQIPNFQRHFMDLIKITTSLDKTPNYFFNFHEKILRVQVTKPITPSKLDYPLKSLRKTSQASLQLFQTPDKFLFSRPRGVISIADHF